jgi:hypothetical protein
MTVEVANFASAVDIPKVLRETADAIEAGEYGKVQFIAAILIRPQNAPPVVFSWGQCSNLEVIGAFEIAHHWILHPR